MNSPSKTGCFGIILVAGYWRGLGTNLSSKSTSAINPSNMVVKVSVMMARMAYCSSMPETKAMHTSMIVADREYSMKRRGLLPRSITRSV